MCRQRKTHADCPHCKEVHYEDWWDRFGGAHYRQLIVCDGGTYSGRHFSGKNDMPRECTQAANSVTWDAIVKAQAEAEAAA